MVAENFFNTAFSAKDVIENGNPMEKQAMLTKIGENFLMKDQKIVFTFRKPFDVLLKSEYRTNVLARLDDYRTFNWLDSTDLSQLNTDIESF